MTSFVRHAVFSDDIKKQPSHFHDCHQIIFIKKGEIEIAINGALKTARSGDIVIISRFENHSIKVISKQYERYVLRIAVDLPADDVIFAVFTNRPHNFGNIISLGSHVPTFRSLFDRLVSEHSLQGDFSDRLKDTIITEILIYLNRILPFKLAGYDSLVAAVKSELENFYPNDFKLNELAKNQGVSVSTLTHTFKKTVGVSIFDYLTSCRMTAAKKYLTTTDMPIGEIVAVCGFTDNSNFSRAFKKLNNMSPTEFRKRYKK